MTGQPTLTLDRAEDCTDRELLLRFATEREQGAFAALVGRHGPCVLRACHGVLGNAHDAEEVFQATFLTLARKAGAIDWQESVRPWLVAVARRLALRASADRRRGRERCEVLEAGGEEVPEPCAPDGDPIAEASRLELRQVIAEELGRLPEKYRAPVVLCYLEGKTNEQAAGELGWPAGSMSRRLARARALLHDRLTRRGLALAAFCFLGVAAIWALRGWGTGPEGQTALARAMAPFRSVRDGGEGLEVALLRLAGRGFDRTDDDERQRLLRAANRTAEIAEALHDHDPGQKRGEWRRLAGRMRRSALDLAAALDSGDEHATRSTARRLTATCQSCHATFRD
jgi:RNA polymerase sigma-70 factor (ECF subfamily)